MQNSTEVTIKKAKTHAIQGIIIFGTLIASALGLVISRVVGIANGESVGGSIVQAGVGVLAVVLWGIPGLIKYVRDYKYYSRGKI